MSEEANTPQEAPTPEADATESAEAPKEARPGTDEIYIPRRPLYALIIPLAFVTGLAAGYVFWGRPEASTGTAAATDTTPAALEPEEVRFEIDLDDDPALGPADAPITIVEFSDFNCPFCRRFHIETFPSLLAAYPDQIYFVYRDFPVVGGFEAAQAAECADEQGGFWPYHDLLLSASEAVSDTETYGVLADQVGLDSQALLECLESGQFSAEVEADARYASGLGVTGTPTFFINGVPLVGAQPLQAFQQLIDQELAK